MADPSDGSFNLKHRLVGATVLILGAVILLPRALTGTDTPSVQSIGNGSRNLSQIQPQVFSGITPSEFGTVKNFQRTKIEILDHPSVAKTEERTVNPQSSDFRDADVGKDRIRDLLRKEPEP